MKFQKLLGTGLLGLVAAYGAIRLCQDILEDSQTKETPTYRLIVSGPAYNIEIIDPQQNNEILLWNDGRTNYDVIRSPDLERRLANGKLTIQRYPD